MILPESQADFYKFFKNFADVHKTAVFKNLATTKSVKPNLEQLTLLGSRETQIYTNLLFIIISNTNLLFNISLHFLRYSFPKYEISAQ